MKPLIERKVVHAPHGRFVCYRMTVNGRVLESVTRVDEDAPREARRIDGEASKVAMILKLASSIGVKVRPV